MRRRFSPSRDLSGQQFAPWQRPLPCVQKAEPLRRRFRTTEAALWRSGRSTVWRQEGDGGGPMGQSVADCFAHVMQVMRVLSLGRLFGAHMVHNTLQMG